MNARRRTPRRAGRRRIGAAVALLATGAASAQVPDAGDPAVVTPRVELKPFHLYGIDGAFEFEWRRDVDDVDPDNGPSNRTEEDRFREILELRTGGYIGHPNLIELDLGGRLWFEQRRIDIDSGNESIDQTLYEWDASAFILKETTLPLTIYTRQNVSDVDREFGGSLENTIRETGGRLNIRDIVFPTNVQIFRREIKQNDRLLNQDFDIEQNTIQADGRVEMGQQQRLAWDVQYDDVDESGDLRRAIDLDRFQGNATHTLQFGDERQNLVRTRVRYFDESGDRELRQISVDPRLRLRHDDTLQSWYDYSFGQDERPDQKQRSHRATANLQHDLFDSVTTIGTAGYERFEITTEDFDSDDIFGRVNSEYRKEVPYGTVMLGLDLAYSHLDQSDRGAAVDLADQVFVFNAANMIVIDQRNVIEGSIVITDLSGFIVYTVNVDYLVRADPARVEIMRLAGGSIAPGQAVLVDYTIGPQPGGETDTTNVGLDARYTFDEGYLQGLAFYVQYRHQSESRDLRDDDFPENDFDDTRFGVEYDRWRLFFRAEGQKRTGSLSPFDAIRLEGRYVEPLGRGSNLVLSGIFQEIDRKDDDLRTTTTTLSGQWNQRIGDRWALALIVQYQWSDDNRSFDSEAFEQQFDVSWRRGRTEVYAQIRNVERDTNADDTTLQRFIVGLRREF